MAREILKRRTSRLVGSRDMLRGFLPLPPVKADTFAFESSSWQELYDVSPSFVLKPCIGRDGALTEILGEARMGSRREFSISTSACPDLCHPTKELWQLACLHECQCRFREFKTLRIARTRKGVQSRRDSSPSASDFLDKVCSAKGTQNCSQGEVVLLRNLYDDEGGLALVNGRGVSLV